MMIIEHFSALYIFKCKQFGQTLKLVCRIFTKQQAQQNASKSMVKSGVRDHPVLVVHN